MQRILITTMTKLLLALSAVHAGITHANENPPSGNQSYESCGLITGEYVTVLQLISRGITPENLKQSLPDISEKARGRVDTLATMARRDGLIDTYSTINSEYAGCSRKVFKANGMPRQGSREAHFHRCAGENKVGYEIAISALIGASEQEVAGQLDPQHRALVRSTFSDFQSEGGLGMFDGLATELKRCLSAIP